MLSLHSDPISFSRLPMSSRRTWSYSLKAFPLLLVMYLFMTWPNLSARDPKLVPVDCGNFHDPSFIFRYMRRSCCTKGKKQITLLSSVCLRPHFPLQSQQLIAYWEWRHFVFLNTGSKKAAVVSWILACLDFLRHADFPEQHVSIPSLGNR